MDEMIGKVLGNRYELLEKVGAGGMATVYKAKCRLLNRFVAVKILREEFTTDAEFLARFKVEAQAAASLSHPNIISVYDVGNQDNIYYIVMEYVQGLTLKQYIEEKGPIHWKKAVNIMLQICSALEHAHNNKIIHHDIKPQNIMITPGMVAKVMDFGIARAATSTTLNTSSDAIGSVHYFSPEQARGGFTDEKSDLYSLGIVFYEMLTGKVPFDADTPVAIALKHLEDEIEAPQKLNPNLPNSVNSIVVKATKKNKADRYSSAQEMIRDLYNALESPDVPFAQNKSMKKDKQNTQKFDSVKDYDSKINLSAAKRTFDEKSKWEAIEREKKAKKEKGSYGTVVAGIIAGIIFFLILTVGLGLWLWRYFSGSDVSEMEVPNIVGEQFEQAKANLNAQKITVSINSIIANEQYGKGQIISQEPTAGKSMKVPGTISVIVSDGQGVAEVPDVVNKELKEAKYILEEKGFESSVVNEYNDEIPKGYVFRQSPLPTYMISKGSEVEIYVSDGPAPKVAVPKLRGLTEEQAKQTIESNRLTLDNVEYIEDKNAKTGVVVSQSIYEGTTVEVNTKITITVNKYKEGQDEQPVEPEKPVEQVTKNLIINFDSTKDVVNKGDNEEFVLKVETEGAGGKKTVYAKVHTKADKQVIVPITGNGSIFVKVYIDDNLNSEQTLNF